MTAVVISLSEHVSAAYKAGKLPVETMLRHDMKANGYNPANPDDVKEYYTEIQLAMKGDTIE